LSLNLPAANVTAYPGTGDFSAQHRLSIFQDYLSTFSKYLLTKARGQQMHEISLVRNIFTTLEDEFPGEIDRVRGIYLTVGLLSNVQPILMQSAFEAVLEDDPRYNKAQLHVEVLPVLVYCDDCNKTTEVLNYKFVCSCGKPSRNIVQGEELLISKVEFADE
jgi:hydrogenase nickel incorporation protein HypA/HybF